MAIPKISNGFTLNGPRVALPVNSTVPGIYSKLTGTPATNALSSAAQPDWKTTLNTVMSGYKAPTTEPGPVNPARPNQTMTTLPKATGLISKEIKTNVDGSKSEVHYDNKTQDTGTKTYAPGSEGNWGPSGIKPGSTPVPETPPETQKQTPPDISYAGLIGQGQGLYGQLPAVGQQAAALTAQAQKEYADIGRQAARGQAGYSTTGTSPVAEGNAAVLARTAAAQQQAVTGGAQLGLTGLAQQQSALTGAGAGIAGLAGAVAPRQQGYVLINPVTGEPVGGVGGAESAITRGAQYGALETGVGQSALDSQAIRGAESGIASVSDLITRGNLNPNTVNLVNEGIQGIQKNLSNADYQTLLNSLDAINAALTKVTGTPVDIATLSSSQGTSLIATINNQVQIAKAIAAAKAVPQTGGQTTPQTGGDIYNW